MRNLYFAIRVVPALVAVLVLWNGEQARAELQEVAAFGDMQATGVAVSQHGRMFVNFPYWSDNHTISVAEVVNGKPVLFPDEEWNKAGAPLRHFICVQSVYVDAEDYLWVLDPAAPKSGEVVAGGPKLVRINLKTNQVEQIIPFDETVAPKKSYLNDVCVATGEQVAYITDSGLGAIIVVDLKAGKARRALDGCVFTKGEEGFKLQVDGRDLIEAKTGLPPTIHADGIALDTAQGYLYFHALTAHMLYRVKTEDLKNYTLSETDLEKRVEKVVETPACDGMLMGPDGGVYLTDLEHGAVVRVEPFLKTLTTMVADKRLQWPDSMSWGPDGALYISASQIENSPRFNDGKNARTEPYRVFKWVVPPVVKSEGN
ncbi:MAG: L-dopachrome tautomerase-related protein [Chthoniobacteraceae bacterium]